MIANLNTVLSIIENKLVNYKKPSKNAKSK